MGGATESQTAQGNQGGSVRGREDKLLALAEKMGQGMWSKHLHDEDWLQGTSMLTALLPGCSRIRGETSMSDGPHR